MVVRGTKGRGMDGTTKERQKGERHERSTVDGGDIRGEQRGGVGVVRVFKPISPFYRGCASSWVGFFFSAMWPIQILFLVRYVLFFSSIITLIFLRKHYFSYLIFKIL